MTSRTAALYFSPYTPIVATGKQTATERKASEAQRSRAEGALIAHAEMRVAAAQAQKTLYAAVEDLEAAGESLGNVAKGLRAALDAEVEARADVQAGGGHGLPVKPLDGSLKVDKSYVQWIVDGRARRRARRLSSGGNRT